MKRALQTKLKYPHLTSAIISTLLLAALASAKTDRATLLPEDARVVDSQDPVQETKPCVRELKPGQVIERELVRGETHCYSVTLRAGEYMKVLIEKQSTDLEMRAIDPAGNVVADVSLGETGTTEVTPPMLVIRK